MESKYIYSILCCFHLFAYFHSTIIQRKLLYFLIHNINSAATVTDEGFTHKTSDDFIKYRFLNFIKYRQIKSESVGLPSDETWKQPPPDAYGIMIVLFDPIDTQQLNQTSLTQLTQLQTTLIHKTRSALRYFLVSDSGKVGKTAKFPQTTASLNYLFNQITPI